MHYHSLHSTISTNGPDLNGPSLLTMQRINSIRIPCESKPRNNLINIITVHLLLTYRHCIIDGSSCYNVAANGKKVAKGKRDGKKCQRKLDKLFRSYVNRLGIQHSPEAIQCLCYAANLCQRPKT